jgi:hypothetical protein
MRRDRQDVVPPAPGRRAPLTVVAVLAAFTLAVTLLSWPAGALTRAHAGNV